MGSPGAISTQPMESVHSVMGSGLLQLESAVEIQKAMTKEKEIEKYCFSIGFQTLAFTVEEGCGESPLIPVDRNNQS
jgi:hypothetical protein